MLRKSFIFSWAILTCFRLFAQQDSTGAQLKILLIPYSSMMYFSDADPDIARFSKLDEPKVRNQIRNNVEANIYHQLLSAFQVVSIINASSLNAEDDLKKIYAATRYFTTENIPKEKRNYSSKLLVKKDKKQQIYTDEIAMVGEIQDPDLYKTLYQKYQCDYILTLSQFEITTSNKNTIEWTKQEYNRTFNLHYNVWDKSGKLILAEVLVVSASGENTIKEITEKYLITLGQKLRDILKSELKQ